MKTLTKQDIAVLFGTEEEKLGIPFTSFYETLDMSYEVIQGKEKESLVLDILKKIDCDKQVIGAPERVGVWYDGWNENLQSFRKNRTKLSVVPKFIRPNSVIRLNGQFVRPSNPFFERDFAKLLQLYVYEAFMTDDIKNVYEFGCGSGFNLLNLHLTKPNLNLYGSDFVQSSVDLVNEMGAHFEANMQSSLFDMLRPDYSYEILENSCVFTHGAIEQLAGNFHNFINFIINKKPNVCFHIEPVVEVYDNSNLFDYLQTKFHLKRGYSTGLITYLKDLEREGKVTNVACKRVGFGSKFMEGYTLISWKPA